MLDSSLFEGIDSGIAAALTESYQCILEAFHGPYTEDQVELILDNLESNNRRLGLPFDREATKQKIIEHPGRFHLPPRGPMKSSSEMKNVMAPGGTMTARDARQRYYESVLHLLSALYTKYGAPFDYLGLRTKVLKMDGCKPHKEFDRTGQVPRFASLQDATGNPVVHRLCVENPTFAQCLIDATKFMKEARSAESNGEMRNFRDLQKFKKNNQTPSSLRPLPADKNSAQELKMSMTSPGDQIGLFAEKCGGNIPYSRLYGAFAERVSPEVLGITPKPNETIADFMARATRSEDDMSISFAKKLHDSMNVAYSPIEIEDFVNKFKSSPKWAPLYKEVLDSVKRSIVLPKDQELYAVWKTVHSGDKKGAAV